MNPIADVVALVRGEFARRLRGLKRSIYAGAVGVVFLTAAFVFLLLAIYLWLAEAYGSPAAALIMAAGLLVIGVIALVIASIRTRKRDLGADLQLIASEQMGQVRQFAPTRPGLSTLVKMMGVAFAVGLFAGRKK
jgi:hypothetical protein